MSLTEDNNAERNLNECKESEDNEEVDSSDELERKKQITNEFNAEGNLGQYQVFIQNLNALNMGYKQISKEEAPVDLNKKFDLCNIDECVEFVERYGASEYVTVAIILCTFEAVSLSDMPELQYNLTKYLPKVDVVDNESEENSVISKNPYISLNTILAIIGGKRFVTKEGQACIGLGENSKQALTNLMEAFPILRNTIVSWLVHVNEVYKFRTTFDAYQIATAFARVISIDIADAERRIFPKLCLEPKNTGILGILMYKLYVDSLVNESIQSIIWRWIKSDSTWLWRPISLTYSYLVQADKKVYFETALQQAISRRIKLFKNNDLAFIALVLRQSEGFRTMVAEIFHDAFLSSNKRENRLFITALYIKLVRQCYYKVNKTVMDLPLITCDTKQQQEFLSPVIECIMSEYRFRKQLYLILEAYMREISNYNFSKDTINHIAAYFYNMGLYGSAYREDILCFIQNCMCKTSIQVCTRLYKAYERKGE